MPCLMSGTPTVYELNHGSILRPATECRGIASDPPCWPCRGGGAQPRPTIAAQRQGTAAPRTGLAGEDPLRRPLPRLYPANHRTEAKLSVSAHVFRVKHIENLDKRTRRFMGLFACLNFGGIWMVWRNAGGICERKILFRIKKISGSNRV